MQEHYRNLGYRITYDGAVEFYYVSFRIHKSTNQREVCLCGNFSWSNHLHDPARTIQALFKEDKQHRYSRFGPFPNRAQAEQKAMELALQFYNDPSRYGIWATGGISEITNPDYRQPNFW